VKILDRKSNKILSTMVVRNRFMFGKVSGIMKVQKAIRRVQREKGKVGGAEYTLVIPRESRDQ